MCECNLLVEKKTGKPIPVPKAKYRFAFHDGVKEHTLLSGMSLHGVIDFAAAHEIKDMYGISHGFMFIMGKADEGISPTQDPLYLNEELK